ncbi:uncharacterized protein C2845_PM03G14600 [Panicum miliaceum]|uniref:Uncharacterized protein n=1 Tax=Panicum miliaceum TaxID=4540 RepID=A0A3L6TCF0_PANMI|nr:uncharacterized protein C2845_PM03G14600 [Panicum miliaceum]
MRQDFFLPLSFFLFPLPLLSTRSPPHRPHRRRDPPRSLRPTSAGEPPPCRPSFPLSRRADPSPSPSPAARPSSFPLAASSPPPLPRLLPAVAPRGQRRGGAVAGVPPPAAGLAARKARAAGGRGAWRWLLPPSRGARGGRPVASRAGAQLPASARGGLPVASRGGRAAPACCTAKMWRARLKIWLPWRANDVKEKPLLPPGGISNDAKGGGRGNGGGFPWKDVALLVMVWLLLLLPSLSLSGAPPSLSARGFGACAAIGLPCSLRLHPLLAGGVHGAASTAGLRRAAKGGLGWRAEAVGAWGPRHAGRIAEPSSSARNGRCARVRCFSGRRSVPWCSAIYCKMEWYCSKR